MTDQARPEEAARALTEIGQRQEQVIRLAVIPNWYWWAIAVLMVAFAGRRHPAGSRRRDRHRRVRGRRAHHHRMGGVPRGP